MAVTTPKKKAPPAKGALRAPPTPRLEHQVKDLSPRRVGPQGDPARREGDARAHGAPRASTRAKQPLAGAARRRLAPHDDRDRGPHRDADGARRRGPWTSCNIYSTQDEAAAAIASQGGTPERAASRCSPGRARPSRSTGESIEPSSRRSAGGKGPNLILDDGGDATLLDPQGRRVREGRQGARPRDRRPEELRVIFKVLTRELTQDQKRFTRIAKDCAGVSEETTTGVHRLYDMAKAGTLLFPCINVNDSVTKSKFDNLYGCRESLFDGIKRATDVMLAGKLASSAATATSARAARSAARPRRARPDHRDRSDLRAAGGDGGLPGRDDSRTWSRRPTSSSPRPAASTSSPSSTCSAMKDERDPRQHRPLRQRDPHRLAEEIKG